MAGETEVTISATGATSVEVWTTKLESTVEKPIINIPIPRQTDGSNGFSALVTTYLIDIGRAKELISIQGVLIDDSTTSAKEKKDNLYNIVKNKSKCTITWGTGSRQQTADGNMHKVQITETAGIIVDGDQKTGYEGEKNFAVQLSFMVGTDKGGGD